MQMAARRMSRGADGADRLPLRDRAPADVDRRLVAVGGGHASTVVDDREVSVAVHPAGVDDRPRRSRADRGPARGPDVDAFVHAAPAPPEAARDRAAHGPDEATRRWGSSPTSATSATSA